MKYFYRPSSSGHGTISPTPPSAGQRYRLHPNILPKPARRQWHFTLPQINMPHITARAVLLTIAIIAAAGALWWGGGAIKNSIENHKQIRQQAAVAQEKAEHDSINNEVKGLAKNAFDAAKLGKDYMQKNDLQKAEAAFNLALTFEPNWRDGLVALASVQLQQREYDAAAYSLNKAMMIDPLYPTTQQLLSILYAKTGKPDAAQIASQKATYFAEKLGIALGG